jgi:hypothetical protein
VAEHLAEDDDRDREDQTHPEPVTELRTVLPVTRVAVRGVRNLGAVLARAVLCVVVLPVTRVAVRGVRNLSALVARVVLCVVVLLVALAVLVHRESSFRAIVVYTP